MAEIVPSVTAYDEKSYKHQMDNIAHIVDRIHIDLGDGKFEDKKTVSPEQTWWPASAKADIHLMYKNAAKALEILLPHHPYMVIVHAESEGDFGEVVEACQHYGVRVGVALLQQTSVRLIADALNVIDHVMVFSGNLGHFGGQYDRALIEKVLQVKRLKPEIEVGWDGGVNDQNVSELVFGGLDVLNVGGFIQNSPDPERAYVYLQRIADETGTT